MRNNRKQSRRLRESKAFMDGFTLANKEPLVKDPSIKLHRFSSGKLLDILRQLEDIKQLMVNELYVVSSLEQSDTEDE